jgi:hypothetical protein
VGEDERLQQLAGLTAAVHAALQDSNAAVVAETLDACICLVRAAAAVFSAPFRWHCMYALTGAAAAVAACRNKLCEPAALTLLTGLPLALLKLQGNPLVSLVK